MTALSGPFIVRPAGDGPLGPTFEVVAPDGSHVCASAGSFPKADADRMACLMNKGWRLAGGPALADFHARVTKWTEGLTSVPAGTADAIRAKAAETSRALPAAG